jgi:hypothetical protein
MRQWELVESQTRSTEETERMKHLAHASALHWEAIGTPANRQRGLALLASAYAVAGDGPAAVAFAKTCVKLGESQDSFLTAFDRVAAATCMTLAFRSNQELDSSVQWEKTARSLAAGLDDEERRVIDGLLTLVVAARR